MKPIAGTAAVLLLVALNAGCVERRFVITSDPPGALVYHNGVPIGTTPVDESFIYYGTHEFTLVRDGFETLVVKQPVPTPWYEYIGIDFFSENVWPCQVSDVRRLHFTMQPAVRDNADELLEQAKIRKNEAAGIGPPRQEPPPPQPAPVPQPGLGAPTARPAARPTTGPTTPDPLRGQL
jgi:hypothetical protein